MLILGVDNHNFILCTALRLWRSQFEMWREDSVAISRHEDPRAEPNLRILGLNPSWGYLSEKLKWAYFEVYLSQTM